MKKTLILGILVLIIAGFVSAQGNDTLKAPDRVDSLEAKIEKLETEVYDKSIEGVNRSISHINTVATIIGVVVVLIGLLGGYAVIKTRGTEREVREDMKEMRARAEHECRRAENLADRIREETEKAGTSRVQIESIRSAAEETVRDMESKYKEMEKLLEKAKIISDETGKKQKAAEMAARSAEAERLFLSADELRKKARLDEAIEVYEQVIGLTPEHGKAYNDLGTALAEMAESMRSESMFMQAINSYQLAIKYLPARYLHYAYTNWGEALYGLAALRRDEGLYNESFAKYAIALKHKSDHPEAYSNWSATLIGLGKLKNDTDCFSTAVEKAKKATEIREGFGPPWYNKACAHSLLRQRSETLESLERAIELDKRYKAKAKKDEDFKWLWDDPEFKRLVE